LKNSRSLYEDLITGWNLFPFNITTKEEYEAVEEAILLTKYTLAGGSVNAINETKIYEMAVIIEAEADIKDVIYV
jgi:hypothetical protein